MDIIYLISCALNKKIPSAERVAKMDLDKIFAIASRHMLSALVSMALKSAGVSDPRADQAIARALRKTAIFDHAWKEVRGKLEEAGIWYMPLKGAVLKNFYPKYGMREFADHDILFDSTRAEDVKNIMEGLGFSTEHFGNGSHDVYFKQPVLNFEMHPALFSTSHDEKLYEYYKNVNEKLLPDLEEGSEEAPEKAPFRYGRHFSDEDFYLYFLSHEYKHYANGGTGLRSLVDTYVFLTTHVLNLEYVEEELEKLGLTEFEEQNRMLALHLFRLQPLTDRDKEMLEYIFSSGTYGTVSNSVKNKMKKNNWGKFRYMLYRFSVPVSRKNPSYRQFANMYPFFYKHKIFLPALPFYRTFRSIKGGRFKGEAQVINRAKNSMNDKKH